MRVHFIQQEPWVEPGEYLAWANRRGHAVSVTRCWQYEEPPREADCDMLVVLGGSQCPATTREECGFFDAAAQKRLIRQYADAGRVVIGVCLGAQLVGEARGAPYARSPEREIGPVRARLTAAGRADAFLSRFPDAFDAGEWHNDMPGLTPDAVVLAESDGCPRQIVRYGRYVYGFQTHMEFTRAIIAAGVEACGGEVRQTGRFVQSAEELLAWDYTEMNRMLSGFLDALAEDYLRSHPATVSRIMERMIAFSRGNIHDIDHFIRVWAYARTICELEGVDPRTQYTAEVAAITHDIACPLCREKYGNTNGKRQEEEGEPMVRRFLSELPVDGGIVDRVAFLVGHHHTLTGIDSPDWQILVEADYIANASENGYSDGNIQAFMEKVMRTDSGKRLCREVLSASLSS